MHDENARLVVANSPGPLAWVLAGMGLVMVAVAATSAEAMTAWDRLVPGAVGLALMLLAWACFPATRTVFSRPDGVAVHEERRLLHKRLKAVPLDSVQGARVEAQWSDSARLTRLTLATTNGPVPLEHSFGAGDRRAVGTAIDEWLTRPTGARPGA
ncbi:MAG: hypothetical protein HUJ24_04615 [Rhodobacteraceae bacterium]|nr:hypothetical protein [Paracoccaceae bacterium]